MGTVERPALPRGVARDHVGDALGSGDAKANIDADSLVVVLNVDVVLSATLAIIPAYPQQHISWSLLHAYTPTDASDFDNDSHQHVVQNQQRPQATRDTSTRLRQPRR